MKEDMPKATGRIVDKMPNATFKIQINNTQHIVEARVSIKMRKNLVGVVIGDIVDVELSPQDLSVGRIIHRHS